MKNIAEYRRLLKAQNISVIGNASHGIRLQLKCNLHGIFSDTTSNIRKKIRQATRVCPYCNGSRLHIMDLKSFVEDRKGTLKTKNYRPDRKLLIKCDNGHHFPISSSNLLRGKWCPKCAGKNKTLSDVKAFLNKKGFTLLSKKYVRSIEKLKLMCPKGHLFYASFNKLQQGQSCTACKIFIGEEIVRLILQGIFKTEFPKTRSLSWLENKKTGARLELDGYSKKLNLAFEHHGKQHLNAKTMYYDKEGLKVRKKLDVLKRQLCANHRVSLIEIDQVKNFEDAYAKVLYSLSEAGIAIPKHHLLPSKILKRVYSEDKIKTHNIALEKVNIKCLSKSWAGTNSQYEYLCCKCRYRWKAQYKGNECPSGCPKCAGILKITTTSLKKNLKKKKIQLQSTSFLNSKSKVLVECKVCKKSYQIAAGKVMKNGCKVCNIAESRRLRRTPIKTIKARAKAIGLTLLSTGNPTSWSFIRLECNYCGKISRTTPFRIQQKKVFCKCKLR